MRVKLYRKPHWDESAFKMFRGYTENGVKSYQDSFWRWYIKLTKETK